MELIIFLIILFICWKNRGLILGIGVPLLILAVLVGLFGPFFIGLLIVIFVIFALYEMCK